MVKPLVLVGVILVIVGGAGLLYGGITYTTDRDSVDLGVVDLSVEHKERLTIHPAIGAIVLVGGLVVTVVGFKRG